jgi:hypothetical protein
MNLPHRDSRGWYSIEGEPTRDLVQRLAAIGHLDQLSITKARLVTAKLAAQLAQLPSVGWLWLWCDVTRTAMRHIAAIPGLHTLDVLALRHPGNLEGLNRATSLRTLRANHYLSEQDLLAISQCASLCELGVQHAKLTPRALEALLRLKHLKSLDLEGTDFDDDMAESMAETLSLESLDLGATKITRRGLQRLTAMQNLRVLDLWATPLIEDDFALLSDLPALEYVSIGGYEGSPSLEASRVLPLLLSLPSLKRVWLDGVALQAEQLAALKDRLESVRVT